MGELHPIGDGGTSKLLRAHKEGHLTDAINATATFIVKREEMIARGDSQELIDFVSAAIDNNLSRRTEDEKRLIELCAVEIRNLRARDPAQI